MLTVVLNIQFLLVLPVFVSLSPVLFWSFTQVKQTMNTAQQLTKDAPSSPSREKQVEEASSAPLTPTKYSKDQSDLAFDPPKSPSQKNTDALGSVKMPGTMKVGALISHHYL
jgi:hypothetical protein